MNKNIKLWKQVNFALKNILQIKYLCEYAHGMFFVDVVSRLLTFAAAITFNSIRSFKMTSCGGRKVKSHIEGVIFDMDGTLTIPVLDFKELRRWLGINDTIDILEYANKCVGNKKQEVFRTIETFEDEGNKNLKLQPHIHELFSYLKRNQLQTALITRNNSKAVEAFFEKFLAEDQDNVFHSTDIFSQVLTAFLSFS